MGRTHWLDEIGQELWEEIRDGQQTMKGVIAGDVPLGTIRMTEDEQLNLFLGYTEPELESIRQTVGDEEFMRYTTAMGELMNKKLGPLAGFVRQTLYPQGEEETSGRLE